MEIKMKKYALGLLILIILVGCSPQSATPDRNMLYTQAAQTVFVQMTQASALTPSATATLTPIPTATITLTPVPSPTPVPPTPTWAAVQAGKVVAPVLLYYRIAGTTHDDPNYKWNSSVNIAPDNFKIQMQVLKTAGYGTMTVTQLADTVRKGGTIPPNPIVITFDTAAISTYTQAFQIMKQYGYVGTVYTVVGQIGGGGMMSLDQMKEMVAAGWEFGSKGMTGIDVVKNHDQAGYEISTSRVELGKKLGVEVKSYSYPGGAMDSIVNGSRVSGWGYQSAVGLGRSADINNGNLFYLPRYEIQKDMKITDYASILPVPPTWIPTEIPTPTVEPTK
jgi:peptidoglycan/xylan/chitin deacetylase (PgdA/CDA1 family)